MKLKTKSTADHLGRLLPCELRAIGGKFAQSWRPDSVEDAIQWIAEQQAEKRDIYFVAEDFTDDWKHTTTKACIKSKRRCILDLDVPKSLRPATGETRAEILKVADDILKDLESKDIVPEAVIHTGGGGVQIQIRLADLPTTCATTSNLKAFIHSFSKYGNDFCIVDPCGKDILRPMRLGGTLRFKGGQEQQGTIAKLNENPTKLTQADLIRFGGGGGGGSVAEALSLCTRGIPTNKTLAQIEEVFVIKASGTLKGRATVHGSTPCLSVKCVREGNSDDSDVFFWLNNGVLFSKCQHSNKCDIETAEMLKRYDIDRSDVSDHFDEDYQQNKVYENWLRIVGKCETRKEDDIRFITKDKIRVRIWNNRASVETKNGWQDAYAWSTKNRHPLARKMVKHLVDDGETLSHDERLVKQLLKQYKLCICGGEVYQYVDTGYRPWRDDINADAKNALHSIASEDRISLLKNYGVDTIKQEFTESKVRSVLTTLRGMLEVKRGFDKGKINYSNGVFLLATGELVPHGPEHFINTSHEYEYDPEATSSEVDKFLAETYRGQPEQLRLFKQYSGCVHATDRSHEMIGLLVGQKRTGKTTVKDLMAKLATKQTEIKAKSFSTPFGLQKAVGASLLTTAELEGCDSEGIANAKAISGGEAVDVNRKHLSPIDMVINANLLWQSNKIPELEDTSGAILSRLLVIQHVHHVAVADRDRELKARLTEPKNMAYIAKLARDGYHDFLQNGFCKNPHAENLIQSLEEQTDPMAGFIAERCVLGDYTTPRDVIYNAYQNYVDDIGADRKMTKQKFARTLSVAAAARVKNGPRQRDGSRRVYTWHGIKLRKDTN